MAAVNSYQRFVSAIPCSPGAGTGNKDWGTAILNLQSQDR